MPALTNLSIRYYMGVYALIVVITVVGIYSYVALPREADPDITIPFVIVTATYTGVSPSDMETLVTRELEKEIKNIANIKEMRSSSKEGVSAITVEFDPSVDIDEALQKVRDKVNIAKANIPADADEPQVKEINFSELPIMLVNVSGEYGLTRLKKVAEDLKDQIEQIPGILEARLIGGLEREVQVDVDPERLRYYQVSMGDIIDIIRDENVTIPGGSMDVGDYKYLVRVPGEFKDPLKLRDIVIKSDNLRAVYLRDVAQVSFGYQEPASLARLNGVDCISISVKKRAGANIIEVSDAVKALLDRELPSLPGTTKISVTADSSEMTRTLISDLENNIITGLILVVGVLFFFMGLKVAVLVALAIPFSMLISFAILHALGFSLNMVVLFSLTLALGMLVDNAIVIVENIYRHAREGLPPVQAAMTGTAEVAAAVTSSTLTTLAAFFPMMFWPGIMGEFMTYLPYTVSITLSASLFVALVINPMLCATLLKVEATGRKLSEMEEAELATPLRLYRRFLVFALARRGAVFGAAAASLVFAIGLYAAFGHGVEFFPAVEPSKIFVNIEAPSGTRLAATDRFARDLEQQVRALPEIKTFVTNVGVSLGTFDFGGPGEAGPSDKARVAVDFLDRKDRALSTNDSMNRLRDYAAGMAGVNVRIEPAEMGPPTGPPVNIEISGKDYDTLAAISHEVEDTLRKIPGLVDVQNNYSIGRPELKVEIDREDAARYGLRTVNIANALRAAINGQKASTFREGKDEYDIRVRFTPQRRARIEDLQSYFVRHEENVASLTSFASISTAPGFGDIAHIDQRRVITVSSKVKSGLNENALLAEARAAVAGQVKTPEGYRIDYTGQNKDQQEAETFLTKAFIAAILLIGFILIAQFNSFTMPLIILSSVILSLVGVFLGLLATNTPFGIIMTGVGVISLAGVVVNNAIVLLDYTQKLRERGMEKTRAIITAGMTRLRPVMLTAITTVLGLLPMATKVSWDFKEMALITSSDTADWWNPMAVAVVFGLAFATILTLVVVPTMYSLLDSMVSRVWGAPLTHNGQEHTGAAHPAIPA